MKKKMIFAGFAAVMVLAMVTWAVQEDPGNGAPSGSHYNLNIIAVPDEKAADPEGNDITPGNGHRIFVLFDEKCRILLQEGDFAVIDYDGTDGVAKFRLPAPDPENDGTTTYEVYVRGLGKPAKKGEDNPYANIEPGFIDGDGNEWYSTETVTVERKKGQNKFVNVTNKLLYVYVDGQRYPLFCEELWQFFWDYDNHGLKLCQMRFYPVPEEE